MRRCYAIDSCSEVSFGKRSALLPMVGWKTRLIIVLAVISIVSSVCIIYSASFGTPPPVKRPKLIRSKVPTFGDDSTVLDLIPVGTVVRSASCTIPDYDPYNPGIAALLKEPTAAYVWCNESSPDLTYADHDHIRLNKDVMRELNVSYCEYQTIIRQSDYSVEYGDAVRFTADVTPNVDFVRVRCYTESENATSPHYGNFHAFARPKPDVERRCDERLQSRGTEQSTDLYNVLVIGIDSTSRLNSIRRLNTTRRFLLDDLEGHELRGYSRIGDNTYPNMMALLTGRFAHERPAGSVDNADLLWRHFTAAGYRTLYLEDSYVENHIFNIGVDGVNDPRGFSAPPTDYYFRPMNLAMYGDKNGEAIRRLDWRCRFCVRRRFETEFALNRISDFITMHDNITVNSSSSSSSSRPFFGFAFFSSITHDDFNEAAHVDTFLMRFFDRLLTTGHLSRTVVLLVSDHGMRYGPTRGYTRCGWYEENLPMSIVVLPPTLRQRWPSMVNNLRTNTDRLTTPFDLHETLRRLVSLGRPFDDRERQDAGRHGVSLLDVAIGDRTCPQASIAAPYCECLLSSTVPVNGNDTQVQVVANRTIQYINKQLAAYNGSCSTLSVGRITEARVTNAKSTMVTSASRVFYTLTFDTLPGEGRFQGIVALADNGTVSVPGDILRINSYAKHAGCIEHIIHKKWCYCVTSAE